jgi:NAD(P)-dependent dehydrogenase (short-subunit alcohol dehydrogenase family)
MQSYAVSLGSEREDGMGRLEGIVALVTGAGSGIGRETASRFAAEGAIVAAADLGADTAAQTAATIQEAGGVAAGLEMDVTSSASVAESVERIVSERGGIDVVVNNAGITIVGSVTDMEEDDWDKELAINLKSVYLVSRAVWPHMVERGGGAILSTASIAGMWAIPADAAYCASKAAVIMLTKCMALDGANDKIRAACVCPGFINTPMIEGYFADQPDPAEARVFAEKLHPLGRLGDPKDIADAFVYLASSEANWVTGTALVVDGGLTSGIWGG